MIPGLIGADGSVDPVLLRSFIRMAGPQIDAFLLHNVGNQTGAPAYVVDAVAGLRDAIEKWGTETETARNAGHVPISTAGASSRGSVSDGR